MKSKRIGVVMGGSSAEREVSLRSGRAIATALELAGHDVQRLEINPHGDPLRLFADAKIDVAFLALKGRLGEDGCIQGLLELLGIPYTGSSVLASALAMDKLKAKELFRLHNIPTPPYYLFEGTPSSEAILEAHGSFGYPAVVKPRREGSSIGIAFAETPEQLVEAVGNGLRYDRGVLVERRVRGKEITVGLLDGRVLGALEIAPKSGTYDFASKCTPGSTEYFIPARLSPALYQNVLYLAERAVESLDVSGAARVDLIVTEGQNEYVLEVNSLPGMAPTSLLPKIAAAAGYDFTELCEAMLASARLYVGKPRVERRKSVVALPNNVADRRAATG